MPILLKTILLTLSLAAVSCQGISSSPASRAAALASITGIAVNPITVAPDAYRQPDGSDTSTSGSWGRTAYRLSGGDNIVGAIAGGINRGIAKGQQSDFDTKNQTDRPTVQQAMTSAAPAAVQAAVISAFRSTALGPRIDKSPANSNLYITLEHYGLVRVGLTPSQEVLLAPQLRFNIQTTSAQVLVNDQWVGVPPTNATKDRSKLRINKHGFWSYRMQPCTGPTGHTLHDYATNPALLRSEITNTATAALLNLPASIANQFGS